MVDFPRISIVTPNFNGEAFLEQTIQSVVGQGYPDLEYIIIDGGSTDDSVNIIRNYSKHITYWESEPDNGLYHALQKGFERSTGDIMGWINSDDMLMANSMFTISEIFSLSPEIMWMQGHPTVIDDQNRIVYQRPAVSSKYFFYRKLYHNGKFIQQESTFWSRQLWQQAGGYVSQELKYAGDFELWMRFFRYAPLYVTSAMLGAFRTRKQGQLSKTFYSDYLAECDQVIDWHLSLLSDREREEIRQLKESSGESERHQISFNFSTYKFRIEP